MFWKGSDRGESNRGPYGVDTTWKLLGDLRCCSWSGQAPIGEMGWTGWVRDTGKVSHMREMLLQTGKHHLYGMSNAGIIVEGQDGVGGTVIGVKRRGGRWDVGGAGSGVEPTGGLARTRDIKR